MLVYKVFTATFNRNHLLRLVLPSTAFVEPRVTNQLITTMRCLSARCFMAILLVLPVVTTMPPSATASELIWQGALRVRDVYDGAMSNSLNILAFNVDRGDLMLELDVNRNRLISFSAMLKDIGPKMHRSIANRLNHQRVSLARPMVYADTIEEGSMHRKPVLRFEMDPSGIKVSPKLAAALKNARVLQAKLMIDAKASGGYQITLYLEADSSKQQVLLINKLNI